MTMVDDDIDRAIANYTAELTAHAALGRAEVAELEDHLRTLIDDLRSRGAATAAAIAEARRRIGEPRAVATECARVRTAFGARLEPLRAWTAAAILMGLVVWSAWFWLTQPGVPLHVGVEVGLGLILVVGLAARRTWPRAILFGHAAMTAAALALFNARYPGYPEVQITLVAFAAATALLAPWRRGELTGTGWSLAAWAMAYVGASFAERHDAILPTVVLAGIMVAALGTVVRARWGIVVGLATSGLHAVLALAMIALHARGELTGVADPDLQLAIAVAGAAAAVAAPFLAWRSARPGLGELRALVRG